MKQLILILALCVPAFAQTTYHASTTGSGTACTSGSPCALATALSDSSGPVSPGDTLCIRGGTYTGKFDPTLQGTSNAPIIVRPCKSDGAPVHWPILPNGDPNPDWVVIDGNLVTTLAVALGATPVAPTPVTVVLAANVGFPDPTVVFIDNELIYLRGRQADGVTWNNCIRPYGSTTAAAHSIGASVHDDSDYLDISNSSYVHYRELEVMSSSTESRNFNFVWGSDAGGVRGYAIFNSSGAHNKIINALVHDGGGGAYIGNGAVQFEWYGNLSYNEGYVDWDRGHGQSIYTPNDPATGQRKIRNSIWWGGFSSAKIYSESSQASNVLVEDVIAFNKGVLQTMPGNTGNNGVPFAASHRNENFFAGTGNSTKPLNDVIARRLYTFHPFDSKPSPANVTFGYGGRNGTGLQLVDSRIMGGNNALSLKFFSGLTMTGNTVYAQASSLGSVFNTVVEANLESDYSGTVNTNTYLTQIPLIAGASYVYRFAINGSYRTACTTGTVLKYSDVCTLPQGGWKETTTFDATGSTWTNAAPSGSEVFVIPNEYTSGRAHIAIYNWAGSATVSVNLSTAGLVNGQDYAVWVAENPKGAPVLTRTHNSASPTANFPMNGTTVATAVGLAWTPDTVRPTFAAFIVIPGAQSEVTAPAAPANLTAAWSFSNHGAIANILLTFTNPTSGASVIIEDSTDGTNWSALATTSADATSHLVTGIATGGRRYFRVRATKTGLESVITGPVSEIPTKISCYLLFCSR